MKKFQLVSANMQLCEARVFYVDHGTDVTNQNIVALLDGSYCEKVCDWCDNLATSITANTLQMPWPEEPDLKIN